MLSERARFFLLLMPALACLALAPALRADSGVLIPGDRNAPDPSVLSLAEMQVEIHIDNGDARVWIRQIFINHTGRPQEGNYVFALPSGAEVSDFAVWDGPVRIPAVILERKRAQAIYQQLKSEAIDPGLLQQGENAEGEATQSSVFSAHIVPIPAWGTKRLEIEYHQRIRVVDRKSNFLLSLKPDAYAVQHVAHLSVRFKMESAAPVNGFAIQSKLLPFKIDQQDAHTIRGSIEASDVDLGEDFSAIWGVDVTGGALQVIAYRNPAAAPAIGPSLAPPDEAGSSSDKGKKHKERPGKTAAEPGFFEATAQLAAPTGQPAQGTAPQSSRTVVVLMDTSLSMQWEKLERSYAAAAKILESLHPQDKFNLLLFNTGVESFRPQPILAETTAVMAAMDWLRKSQLRGGTDLQKALDAGLGQSAEPHSVLVLLSDGGADRGIVTNGKLAAWYAAQWNQIPSDRRPRTDIFAVGDDANLPLLRLLARNGGVMEQVLSSEPVDFKLANFLSEMGQNPIGNLHLAIKPQASVDKVYPLDEAVFDDGQASWVGQYLKPEKKASFEVTGEQQGQSIRTDDNVALPAQELDHDQLPRLWAAARVQALLDEIARDGETEAAIDEIIRLAQKYKFVTPYTSFLAAPRALLRPRVIRPGDPVLRIHTDPAIVSVIALFPFGLEKPLRYLSDEDVWETRFLAPPEMTDGAYPVRLVLRDKDGQVYRESKSFVILSKPPAVKVRLARTRFRAGQMVPLNVDASSGTRTLTARLEGLAPVSLHWNREAEASTGQLWLPPGLPAGNYVLTVTAEDVAHNLGSAEVQIEVVP
jgi:Ca-activated chloride channel family protein